MLHCESNCPVEWVMCGRTLHHCTILSHVPYPALYRLVSLQHCTDNAFTFTLRRCYDIVVTIDKSLVYVWCQQGVLSVWLI